MTTMYPIFRRFSKAARRSAVQLFTDSRLFSGDKRVSLEIHGEQHECCPLGACLYFDDRYRPQVIDQPSYVLPDGRDVSFVLGGRRSYGSGGNYAMHDAVAGEAYEFYDTWDSTDQLTIAELGAAMGLAEEETR